MGITAKVLPIENHEIGFVSMIYVLMQDPQDYDGHSEMIFASTSKKVVEAKHDELKKNHKILQKLAKMVKTDLDVFLKDNPYPPPPALDDLPLRPLVWRSGSWNNAYILDHQDECAKHYEKVNAFREKTIQMIKDHYHYPKELESQFDELFSFIDDRSYSIEEVESD
jgi:hypothetical protein